MAKKKTHPLLPELPSQFMVSRLVPTLGSGASGYGDNGPHGMTGPVGDNGPHGMAGAQGGSGPHGMTGPAGDSGPHGLARRTGGLFGHMGSLGYLPDPADWRDKLFNSEDPHGGTEAEQTKKKAGRNQFQVSRELLDGTAGHGVREVWQSWRVADCKASLLHKESGGQVGEAQSEEVRPVKTDGNADTGNPEVNGARGEDPPLLAQRYAAALRMAFGEKGQQRHLIQSEPPPADKLPARIDLRPFMSPIEDQGPLSSCTAHAVMGLIEYLQIATSGKYLDGSRLFLYKATRDLLQWTGDTGAYIRSTLKALSLFGSCPEDFYPYYPWLYDAQPDPFCFSLAGSFKGVSYYRLKTLMEIKRSIAQGYPVAFGFTCYESLDAPDVAKTGIIRFPVVNERAIGGHAVLAVGYIDHPETGYDDYPADGASGYLIIRNSWGPQWGVAGYGLLPYKYIENGTGNEALADDFWTLTQMQFAEVAGAHAAPYTMANWVESR